MAIRFRCAYCNQLLGIARRKAGQVVRCPTCAGQVVVPNPDEEAEALDPAAPPPTEGMGGGPVFERSDFDEVFNVPAVMPPLEPPAVERRAPPAPVAFDVEQVAGPAQVVPAPAAPPDGIVLSPLKATILTMVVILLVALAFGAGLLVGLSFHTSSPGDGQPSGERPAARAALPGLTEQLIQRRHLERQSADAHQFIGSQA